MTYSKDNESNIAEYQLQNLKEEEEHFDNADDEPLEDESNYPEGYDEEDFDYDN